MAPCCRDISLRVSKDAEGFSLYPFESPHINTREFVVDYVIYLSGGQKTDSDGSLDCESSGFNECYEGDVIRLNQSLRVRGRVVDVVIYVDVVVLYLEGCQKIQKTP